MAELLDFGKLAIGGVALIPLIIGLVEFAKTQGLQGRRWFMMLAFLLGILFAGISQAINEGLIAGAWLSWLRVFVVSIGGAIAACAAMGLYDLVDKRTVKHT